MKTYTVDSFKINEYAYKPITASGYTFDASAPFSVNDSDILTRLIQEAGRFCEHYASDLFIDYMSVREYIENTVGELHSEPAATFLFGFRENCVDGNEYILSHYSNDGKNARYAYRSMWRLDITKSRGEYGERKIEMVLGRVF